SGGARGRDGKTGEPAEARAARARREARTSKLGDPTDVPASRGSIERLHAHDRRRTRLSAQAERAVDQADMTVKPRKIAQRAAGQWVELYGEQTHVGSVAKQV